MQPLAVGAGPARGHRRPLWVAAAVLVVLVVLGLGAVAVRLAVDVDRDAATVAADDAARPLAVGLPVPSAGPAPSAVLPPATAPPTGLGTDAALDAAAAACSGGDMGACVELYLSSYRDPALQRYAAYGDTCAGRQPAGTQRACTLSFPR